MLYEWDELKRKKTLLERGVDFADAERLDWGRTLTDADTRNDYGEMRYKSIGPIDGRLHVMAWTWRGDNIRIISLRKANKREERGYGPEILHRRGR